MRQYLKTEILKPAQFATEQQKHLVKTIEGAWTFVPPPLPPNIKTDEIATNLTSCASAIGELNGAAIVSQFESLELAASGNSN